MKTYKHIIVGTGQATGTLLGKLIPTGDTIAVIEGNKVGGSCVNYGCTPTKTMVASAKAFHQAKRGDFYGFDSDPRLNFAKVMARMNEIRNGSSEGLTGWIEETENIDLIRGMASFSGPKTLVVNDGVIAGDNIYLNVGTRPSAPPIEGVDSVDWLDSARLLELDKLPEHLLIIGGGYIGVEFGQVFRRFGSQVTIIQRGDQLMPAEDRDIADSVLEVLKDEGIDVRLETNTTSVSQDENFHLTLKSNGKTEELTGSHLLIAAGRKPNSDTLSLERAGIETDERGFISVDEFCRTNIDGVFAVGDVNGHGAFTHTAVNDGEIVLDYMFNGSRKLSDRGTIYGLFTDPPLGRVGMSEKEALDKGHKILKGTKPMSDISRAKEMGETNGFVKVLVDAETDSILGAAIHGVGGDEIINMIATVMHAKMTYKDYRKIVLVHPTVSELIPYVFDGLEEV